VSKPTRLTNTRYLRRDDPAAAAPPFEAADADGRAAGFETRAVAPREG
jgi:hypothetical protein